MIFQRINMMLFSIASLVAFSLAGLAIAQDQPVELLLNAVPTVQWTPTATYGALSVMPADSPGALWMRINNLKTEFAAAKTEDEQAKVKASLKEVLVESFDFSMKQRKEQLETLSERATKVQAIIDKRLAGKNDMISLQMKSYVIDGPDAFSITVVSPMHPTANEELNSRIREYQAAAANSNADVTKRAAEELQKSLEKQFESDMESRKKDVETVRAQIATLEKQSETRLAKKDEIINLRLQLAINEAQGLGLFPDAAGPNFNYWIAPGVQAMVPGGYGGQLLNAPVNLPQAVGGPPGFPASVPQVVDVKQFTNPGTQYDTTQKPATAQGWVGRLNTASQKRSATYARVQKSEDWMITIEPTEPSIVVFDRATGKLSKKVSLKKFGLPEYDKIELEGGEIVVHTRDGKVQVINTDDGKGWKVLSEDEIQKRSFQDSDRAKSDDQIRSSLPQPGGTIIDQRRR